MSPGDVTRSMQASAPATVQRVVRWRSAYPNGIWGIILLIATEGALLFALYASYFYLRVRTVTWPPAGIEPPDPVVPLILVGVLATTSVPMFLASLSAQRGRVRPAWLFIFVALFVQCGYFAFEMHSFLDDLDKFRPQDNAYGSIYYTVLGADHFHVFVGMLLNLWLLARLLGGLTNYRVTGVRAISWYWHFANLMTLFTIGTLLSPSV